MQSLIKLILKIVVISYLGVKRLFIGETPQEILCTKDNYPIMGIPKIDRC